MKVVWTVVSAPFFVILGLNIETLARAEGWDQFLMTASRDNLLSAFGFIWNPWVGLSALAVVAFTVGLWVDALLKALDSKKPTEEQICMQLGSAFLERSDILNDHLSRIHRLVGDAEQVSECMTLCIRARQLRISYPRIQERTPPDESLRTYQTFFSMVGPLLRDGHVSEAKLLAEQIGSELSRPRQPAGTPTN